MVRIYIQHSDILSIYYKVKYFLLKIKYKQRLDTHMILSDIRYILFSAFINMVISVLAFAVLYYAGIPVHVVYHKFLPLATTAMAFSLLLSILLYLKAKTAPKDKLASGGNSGEGSVGFPTWGIIIYNELLSY